MSCAGKFKIALMQGINPCAQIFPALGILKNVIGGRQSFSPRSLCGHDRTDFFIREAATRHDACNLHPLVAIDHQNPVNPLPVAARLKEQGHHQQHIRRPACRKATRLALAADHRMQNGLQPSSGRWIGKNQAAHRGTIQPPLCAQYGMTKHLSDFWYRCALRPSQFMGDDVGIDDPRTEICKNIGHRTLAAANTTGQANDETHCAVFA